MLLFRSEEHVDRWCQEKGLPRGAVFTPEQMWKIARPWYEHRLSPDWQRFGLDEAQGLFDRAELTGPFWQLPKPTPSPAPAP